VELTRRREQWLLVKGDRCGCCPAVKSAGYCVRRRKAVLGSLFSAEDCATVWLGVPPDRVKRRGFE